MSNVPSKDKHWAIVAKKYGKTDIKILEAIVEVNQ